MTLWPDGAREGMKGLAKSKWELNQRKRDPEPIAAPFKTAVKQDRVTGQRTGVGHKLPGIFFLSPSDFLPLLALVQTQLETGCG